MTPVQEKELRRLEQQAEILNMQIKNFIKSVLQPQPVKKPRERFLAGVNKYIEKGKR